MQLKCATGWFAAGREVEQALRLLSDSAFRLFMWICLRAGRSTGAVQVNAVQLMRILRKPAHDILRDLDELVHHRICKVANDLIVIEDRFWPYERPTASVVDVPSTYVTAVKRAFLRHACVISAFTTADEKLAQEWHRRGIPVETIERAILLGVARKYTACLNHGMSAPIASLDYFTAILSELEYLSVGKDYWAYLASKIQRLQTEYRRRCRVTSITEPMETK